MAWHDNSEPEGSAPKNIWDTPVSQDFLDLAEEIKKDEASAQYHYGELDRLMKEVAELNKRALLLQDKAADHRNKLLATENHMKESLRDIHEELHVILKDTQVETDQTDLASRLDRVS